MLDEAALQLAGLNLAELILDWSSWVIRRVEHVTFYDDVTYRRTVRVDFETAGLPKIELNGGPCRLAPLTLISKRTLTNLDYRDETGCSASPLTSRDDGFVATGMLINAANSALRASDPSAELTAETVTQLRTIATADTTVAEHTLEDLFGQHPADSIYGRLTTYTPFVILARTFAHSHPVIIRLDPDIDGPRNVTFSHDALARRLRFVDSADIDDMRIGPGRTIARSLGWSEQRYWITAPSIGRGGTYHLIVEVPLGLKVTMQALLPFAREGLWSLRRLPTISVAGTMHKARLYVRDYPEGAVGVASIGVRARLSTTIRAATIMAVASTTVLGAGLTAIHDAKKGDLNVGAAATLVLLVPTLAAGYIARGGEEHRLTTAVLWGVRVVAMLVGATTFVAAASLAVTPSHHTNFVVWRACCALAVVLTLVLIGAAIGTKRTAEGRSPQEVEGYRADNPPQRPRPRRQARRDSPPAG